jgi:hypothetical protein
MFKEPEYIFYPITPLKCFSNKQALFILAKRQKAIDDLKKTRAISKKKINDL